MNDVFFEGKIVAGYRPTFPSDVDPRLKEIIQSSWQTKAHLRPDFAVRFLLQKEK